MMLMRYFKDILSRWRTVFVVGLCLAGSSTMAMAAAVDVTILDTALVKVCFGPDVSTRVRTRVTQLLQHVRPDLAACDSGEGILTDGTNSSPSEFVIAIGETPQGRALIDDRELARLGPEGFIVRSGFSGNVALLATRGNPIDKLSLRYGNLGAHFGAYALLSELGFAFLKPLAPVVPTELNWPTQRLNKQEKPYWPIRATHLHTQHPLELTDLLQGWGKKGPNDEAGFYAMLPEWESYVEWLVANRQNRVEWALLWAQSWQEFGDSDRRIVRLKAISDLAHAYGVAAGVDVPLSFKQQHAYRLVPNLGDLPDELAQLRHAVDWLMTAGFDFISTETGSSEFTHPTAEKTLAWMNELARYSSETYGKPTYIKVHCSTGQTASGYPDPQTGQAINFNMLPHYADRRMGVLPHTVQHYGLDDPAPTYGNDNFAYIRDFLRKEVGIREVLYHPETAYWVSFDIDVPLFLPIYADRRVHDLRLLAADEQAGRMGMGEYKGGRMNGQLNFASGFEWGYWFNEVITARAAWNPELDKNTDREAFLSMTTSVLKVFGSAAAEVAAWITDVAAAEHELLIEGKINGVKPANIKLRSGQAYLQGVDTWDDVSDLLSRSPRKGASMTQPARLGLVEARGGRTLLSHDISYASSVQPLLAQMDSTFNALAIRGALIAPKIPAAGRELFAELLDAAAITALRAHQQYGLYDYAAGESGLTAQQRLLRLADARKALDDAAVLVKNREEHYAVADRERIIGWRSGPTAYNFGYLWTVHSLYYWWRDEGKAVDAIRSPCYLNIINPVDVGFGEGSLLDMESALAHIFHWGETRGCLDIPTHELTFPVQKLRSRP